jgi:chemotaxis protein methyltransferase CheR
MVLATQPQSEYSQFIELVGKLLPIRLESYKQNQMERRIRELARRHQASSLLTFAQMLKVDRDLLHAFEQHITINVSEFYRNPEAFNHLAQKVLPELLRANKSLRIWSAGCSYGAEPYTLAMMLHSMDAGGRHRILATDIGKQMLDRARSGAGYSEDDVKALPAQLRTAYLNKIGTTYSVIPAIGQMVQFNRYDLLRDTPTQVFDLIVCRNVVIYFTEEAKAGIFKQFSGALRPSGWLFIGGTETINRPTAIGLAYSAPCFYLKTGA